MSTLTLPKDNPATLAELTILLGSVPENRVQSQLPPGSATEADLLSYRHDGEARLCELVEGVLVEKPMGYYESILAAVLIRILHSFVEEHDLGVVLAPDATIRLAPGLVRLPDVSFVAWGRFPNRELPSGAFLNTPPDLAVEILSDGNTPAEMERKRREYFAAGVRLVWYVDPATRTARVYPSLSECLELGTDGVLDGLDVIPGFRLPLEEWFRRAGDRRAK